MNDKIRVTVTLPVDVDQKFRQLAARKNMRPGFYSEALTEAMMEYITKHGEEVE